MNFFTQRRSLILAAMSAPLAGCAFAAPRGDRFAAAIAKIESASGARLGVAAFDLGRKIQLSYRGEKQMGGPAGLTAYARALGDDVFRLDRWETELNSAIPGDPRDTTSAVAMMRTLQKLTLGDGLPPPQRKILIDWMLGSTTGDTRIRAAVPSGWKVADKTGSGSYGTTNAIGVAWPPGGAPIVIAVFFTQPGKDADTRSDVVADATRAIVAALASP
jgi:beta-lactamase class A